MSPEQVSERLTHILREVFDEETLSADPHLTADDVDGWDSLTHIRLMLTVEREFGIKFAAAEVTGLKNVGELLALIAAKSA